MEVARFEHEGLTCVVLRVGGRGHHCGYVRLPNGHRFYGMDYDAVHEKHGAVYVHGGLTWSDDHLPGEEPDGSWWLGFDAAHSGDIIPDIDSRYRFNTPGATFKDVDYMSQECRNLATQLQTFESLPA